MADGKPTRIKMVTPEFRGSYANLTEARKFGQGEPKYSILGVFDEDEPFVKKMKAAEKTIATEKWGKVPKRMKSAIKFPSDRDDDDGSMFEGKVTISFANKERPGAVMTDSDGDLVEVIEPGLLYSGAWYRASIRPFAWEYEETNSKGVSWSLDNIMLIPEKPGDGRNHGAFTSATTAEQDFANIVDDDDDDDDDEDLVG